MPKLDQQSLELRKELILNFVTQQFWIAPNILINRYNSRQFVVQGSKQVIESLIDLLLKHSSKCGTNLDIPCYLDFVKKVLIEMHVDDTVVKNLETQLHQMKGVMKISEPDLFFSTALSRVLEALQQKIISRYILRLQNMKMLALPADEIHHRLMALVERNDGDISLAFNIEILKEISRNTGHQLEGYDDRQLHQLVVDKIKNLKETR